MIQPEIAARLREAIADYLDDARQITRIVKMLKDRDISLTVVSEEDFDFAIRLVIDGEELLLDQEMCELDTERELIGSTETDWLEYTVEQSYYSDAFIYGKRISCMYLSLEVGLNEDGSWRWGFVINQQPFAEVGRSDTRDGAILALQKCWNSFVRGELGLDEGDKEDRHGSD